MPFSTWTPLLAPERLPTAAVDLDAFDRNVERVADVVRETGRTIRVATKSIRVPALIRRVLEAGPPFRGLMCFCAEEAALLAEQGFDDLLVAYPTLQTSDLRILSELRSSGRSVRLVVDDLEQARHIDRLMTGQATRFPLVVEIDASLRYGGGRIHLGARRSPIRTPDQLREFLSELKKLKHVEATGMMVYEAQVAGVGDRNPWNRLRNPAVRLMRAISVQRTARLRQELRRIFEESGFPLQVFNGGGTGSLTYASRESSLTEVSAGSAFLASHLFDYYSNFRPEPALYFALQAVRRPDRSWITCAGGGYVASGKPGWDRLPLPVWPESRYSPEEGCGEVQTPLRIHEAAPDHSLGAPVFFRPAKAGEIAERFNEYLLISQGRILDRARTYRGLGRCFP